MTERIVSSIDEATERERLAAAIKAMPSESRTLLLIDVVEDSSALGQLRSRLAEVERELQVARDTDQGKEDALSELRTQLAEANRKLEATEWDLLDIAESARGDWTSRTAAGHKAMIRVSALLDRLEDAKDAAPAAATPEPAHNPSESSWEPKIGDTVVLVGYEDPRPEMTIVSLESGDKDYTIRVRYLDGECSNYAPADLEPAPVEPRKPPGGDGPDYVSRGELVEALREVQKPGTGPVAFYFRQLADELEKKR